MEFISALVSVRFFKDQEDGCIIVSCPALKITTFGKNMTEAKKMFKEAFSLWLETTMEDGDIHDTLRALGWTITRNRVVVKEPFKVVPLQLLKTEHQEVRVPVCQL